MTNINVQFTYKTNAAAIRATDGRKVSTANSKMPGSSFATDPFVCNVGSKLREIEGSVCSKCYAIRLAKMRPSVREGYAANEQAVRSAAELDGTERRTFIEGMADQIRRAALKTGELYHRWFDAGDLASLAVLRLIADIARATPEIAHWLPTREVSVVRDFMRGDVMPANLTVRISHTMVDQKVRTMANGLPTSSVHKATTPDGHICPASTQGNNCGECRACWDSNVTNVSYPAH
jgi:hypothetical protein